MLLRFDVREADRWMRAGGPAEVERRRVAAALYALEYAAARPSLMPSMVGWGRDVLGDAKAPRTVEALWLRASVALAEGYDRWMFLLMGARTNNRRSNPPAQAGHLVYARQRFPDDPYFRMAEAVGAERLALRPIDPATPLPAVPPSIDVIAASMIDAAGPRAAERKAALDRAAALLEELESIPDLSAEANLRLGYIRLRQGHRDVALGHFDKVHLATPKPAVRYLAYLYSGWALAGLGRDSEAASSYRAALRIVPRAQSASALLTMLLLKSGELAEAERVASGFLEAPPPLDPWHIYPLGEFLEYREHIAKLREAIR